MSAFTISEVAIAACAAGAMGLCAGSFLNVAAHRLPRGLSLIHPPSRCGACGTALAWHDNLPLIGWLMLRGTCRHCGTRYGARYVGMELLCGAVAAGVVAFAAVAGHAPSLLFSDESLARCVAAGVLLVVAYLALVATVIDIDHQIIPDELTVPLLVLAPWAATLCGVGLLAQGHALWLYWLPSTLDAAKLATWGGSAVGICAAVIVAAMWATISVHRRLPGAEAWQAADRRAYVIATLIAVGALALVAGVVFSAVLGQPFLVLSLLHAAFGYAVGWLLPVGVALLGALFLRRNAMGFGDAKMFAPLCAFLGPEGALWAFACAAAVGCVLGIPAWLRSGTSVMPFGPSLVIGWAIVAVAGPWLPALPWRP